MDTVADSPILQTRTLTAWQVSEFAPILRSGRTDRDWMDQADQRFPYRCLPMVIVNSFGWDMINPSPFTAVWTGGKSPADVIVTSPAGSPPCLALGHFGAGVLTFTAGHLFQTPPGMNLYVKGPPNEPRDGIQPLEGIVETDWSPTPFTMNWIFTRPRRPVTFRAGEVFCRFFPISRHITEDLEPEIRMIEDNPELHALYRDWSEKRAEFNQGLKVPGSEYVKRKWQKDYFQGGGGIHPSFPDHQTRLRQKEFLDHRPESVREQGLVLRTARTTVVRFPDGRTQVISLPSSGLPAQEVGCPYRFPDAR